MLHAPVRLVVGDQVFDLGNVTVATRTVDDPAETRPRLSAVDTNVGEQVAALLDHAAHMLRKGAYDASAQPG